jgi:hypothetical protein
MYSSRQFSFYLLLIFVLNVPWSADARPRKPKVAVCSTDQLNRLAQATSQQTVNICSLQSRVWVCDEEGRAKCCSLTQDGSLGHCSSSVGYRSQVSGQTSASAIVPAAPVAPQIDVDGKKPGVVPK